MGTMKDAEKEYLKEQVELLKAKCNDRIEVTFELGKKIGKLEHQRNEARRKHGVLKRQVRQIRFVQRAAIEENAKLVCERAILHKELRELRDRVNAFEAAQEGKIYAAQKRHEDQLRFEGLTEGEKQVGKERSTSLKIETLKLG